MIEQIQSYNIERPKPVVVPPTRITVPYLDETITSAHPFSGPDKYRSTGRNILGNKQSLADGEQTAYLLHAAYCGPEEFREQKELIEFRDSIMRRNYLWIFNRNLWNSKGVYVVFDPKAIGLSENLSIKELEKSLEGGRELSNGIRFSNDESTAFAPKESYKLGDHTPESFAQDGFVIATFKEKGAEKIGEVSKKFRYNPKTWGLEIKKDQNPEQRVLAVDGNYGRLGLGDYFRGYGRGGFAFGVL